MENSAEQRACVRGWAQAGSGGGRCRAHPVPPLLSAATLQPLPQAVPVQFAAM